MNQRSLILILLFLWLLVPETGAQDVVNYKHKQLIKALSKLAIPEVNELEKVDMNTFTTTPGLMAGEFFLLGQGNPYPGGYLYIGRVFSCRAGGCLANNPMEENAVSEYFDYLVVFDREARVQQVKVFNYQATHGHEVMSRGWLKQFVGYDGRQELVLGKNLDAISGATVSVYAIKEDITGITSALKDFISDGKQPNASE